MSNPINILITGASGQLARCLIDELADNTNITYTAKTHDELDLTNPFSVDNVLRTYEYDYVVNCAAATNVSKCEENEEYALLGNGYAVKNLAEHCLKYNTKLIHISTDYIFDGDYIPKVEDWPAKTINRYGRSKLLGEKEITSLPDLGYIILRTSWLYSEYGNNFVNTILNKLKNKDVPSVIYDQVGSPTYARDLAKAIISIIESSLNDNYIFKSDIYNYSNEGIISWYDFAQAISDLSYSGIKINPILSSDYNTTVNRPRISILPKSKIKKDYPNILIPYWRNSLEIDINNKLENF